MSPRSRSDDARFPVPEPALATLEHEPFFTQGWLYERKLDGERCLASRIGTQVKLHSRSGRVISHSFPELVDALAAQRTPDFVVDGEVVTFEGNRTSFSRLQPRLQVGDADRARRTRIPVWYYVFDLLSLDHQSTRGQGLRERKRLLRRLFEYADPLRLTPHRNHADASHFDVVCARGWEGLIAKRENGRYVAGRSRNWLKFKCERGQEFVIAGYTKPAGSRVGFGALLLGHYAGSELVYAGKVGTGFDNTTLRHLHGRMTDLEQPRSSFDQGRPPTSGVHWLRPELVAEVAFTEWTDAGQLRHPRFVGLRRDKPAHRVVGE